MASYYSFVLRFLLAFGVAFTYPIFLFSAAAVGVISSAKLARGRRWAFLIVVIVAALITPTGAAFALLALSLPLYAMYEGTYWLIRLILKKCRWPTSGAATSSSPSSSTRRPPRRSPPGGRWWSPLRRDRGRRSSP